MRDPWLPYLIAWAAGFLVALWVALIFWVFRDMKQRHRDPWMPWLAALLVAFLFLPGWGIYMLLRPTLTLDEEYRRALEEEALLEAVEARRRCPGCGLRIDPEWQVCPRCYTQVRKICQRCQRLMELEWLLCPYCGEPVPGAEKTIARQRGLDVDEANEDVTPEAVDEATPEPPSSPPI